MTDHYVSISPRMLFGAPSLDGYRMPIEQVATQWCRGTWTVAEMHDSWPEIDHDAVTLACWYLARYGSRKWRKGLQDWSEKYAVELWKGERVPLPPRFLMGEEGTEAAVEEQADLYSDEWEGFYDIDIVGEWEGAA